MQEGTNNNDDVDAVEEPCSQWRRGGPFAHGEDGKGAGGGRWLCPACTTPNETQVLDPACIVCETARPTVGLCWEKRPSSVGVESTRGDVDMAGQGQGGSDETRDMEEGQEIDVPTAAEEREISRRERRARRRGRRQQWLYIGSLVLVAMAFYGVVLFSLSLLIDNGGDEDKETVAAARGEVDRGASTTSPPPYVEEGADTAFEIPRPEIDERYRDTETSTTSSASASSGTDLPSSVAAAIAEEEILSSSTSTNGAMASTSGATTTAGSSTTAETTVAPITTTAEEEMVSSSTSTNGAMASSGSEATTTASSSTTSETTVAPITAAMSTTTPLTSTSASTRTTPSTLATTAASVASPAALDPPAECSVAGWCSNFRACYPFGPIAESDVSASSSRPPNDSCTGAIPINANPIILKGSTSTATADNIRNCGVGAQPRGVWYSFVSDIASLVHVEYQLYAEGSGRSKLALFYGPSCGRLSCSKSAAGGGRRDGSSQATMDFFATAGRTYYFFLSGETSGTVGEYELRVARHSGTCEEAVYAGGSLRDRNRFLRSSLDSPEHSGSRDLAIFDNMQCSNSGLWHYFVGPGAVVQVAVMVNSKDDFRGSVSVYKGQCNNNLVCVESAVARKESFDYRGAEYNYMISFEFYAERCQKYYMVYSGGWETGLWDMATYVYRKSSNRLRGIV